MRIVRFKAGLVVGRRLCIENAGWLKLTGKKGAEGSKVTER